MSQNFTKLEIQRSDSVVSDLTDDDGITSLTTVTWYSKPEARYSDGKNKRKTLDEPFCPVSQDYETNGLVNQIKLVPSVWTAGMVAWLLCPQELYNKPWGWVSFILPPQIGLLLCIFTQVCFAYYAHDVFFRETAAYDRPQCSDGNSSPLLKFLALCVFLSYGFGSEVMEGLIMHRWISCFQAWEEEKHKKIINDVKNRDGHLWTAALCCQRATNGDNFSALVPAVGLSRRYRWSVKLFYIAVRLVIAMYTIIGASHLIMYSETNKEVIENAVVATFILEIDDYFYKFLITDMIKFDMDAIPPFGISPGIKMTQADADFQYGGTYVLVFLLLFGAGSLSVGWCSITEKKGNEKTAMFWGSVLGFVLPLVYFTVRFQIQLNKAWKRPKVKGPNGKEMEVKEFKPNEYHNYTREPQKSTSTLAELKTNIQKLEGLLAKAKEEVAIQEKHEDEGIPSAEVDKKLPEIRSQQSLSNKTVPIFP